MDTERKRPKVPVIMSINKLPSCVASHTHIYSVQKPPRPRACVVKIYQASLIMEHRQVLQDGVSHVPRISTMRLLLQLTCHEGKVPGSRRSLVKETIVKIRLCKEIPRGHGVNDGEIGI